MFSLTTVSRRDELLVHKRRKRRRMLRERSPSPPAVVTKRLPPPLSTRFTPEEMDNSPELEAKKRFLTMFSLNHLSTQQRKGIYMYTHTRNTHTHAQHTHSALDFSLQPNTPKCLLSHSIFVYVSFQLSLFFGSLTVPAVSHVSGR